MTLDVTLLREAGQRPTVYVGEVDRVGGPTQAGDPEGVRAAYRVRGARS